MKIKPCLYFLGLSCFPISAMALANIFYSFYFEYLISIQSYVTVLISSLLIGFILLFLGKKSYDSINIYEQIFLIFLIYFFISFLIQIPIYYSGYNISFIDSYFESISGLTGTGFTMFDQVKNLDPPLLLWRSSSQWIGGFYFLIFLILIFSNKQINYKFVDFSFNLEKKINFSPNLKSVTTRIFFIYTFLTILIFTAFTISGIRLFDSLSLSMTIISSGGFLPTDSLNDIIRNNFQMVILCFAFLLSILNFYFAYNLIIKRNNLKEHKEDLYLILTIILFTIIFYLINDSDLLTVFTTVLSSVGTSGISIESVPDNFSLYFIILTLIGGSVLSTTSGIKFTRIYILTKAFLMELYRLVQPNIVLNNKIMLSQKRIDNENIKMSFLVFILFFLSLFILSSLLLIDILDFENSFKLSILTLTNTVSSNIYGIEKIQFSDLLISSKISLIIFMVIAKVELISIFLLIQKFFFKN